MNWTTMNTGPSYKASYTPKDLYSSSNDFWEAKTRDLYAYIEGEMC